ncbi:MAG: ATP-grasp domain-containing protein [Clostridia bacterium]|nr:ATP-grasp domain-containing protein [Clostridia bacterium]
MNILFCSAGRRAQLLKNFRRSMGNEGKIVATDLSPYAPALYFADRHYLVPRIDDPTYVDVILNICKEEEIDAITTVIDPEIEILSENRSRFEALGITVLAPYDSSARLCFDKFALYEHLTSCGIPTVLTFGDMDTFLEAYREKKIDFPVFVKPRNGSGSVGARRVGGMSELAAAMEADPTLIIQEYMQGQDLDADVYIDTVSKRVVSAFTKRKLSTTIGGANKTVSFKDPKLFDLISEALTHFQFNGPIDIDFFEKDGAYYLSEINPRFGGAYLHAYGAGVDFVKLIENNVKGIANEPSIGNYEEKVVMMMYDDVVIIKE